jgi:hypothetical protein
MHDPLRRWAGYYITCKSCLLAVYSAEEKVISWVSIPFKKIKGSYNIHCKTNTVQ